MKTSTPAKLECFLSSCRIILEVHNDDLSVHKALQALVNRWKIFSPSSTPKMANFTKTGFRKGRCKINSLSDHLFLRTTPTSRCTSRKIPTLLTFKMWDTPTDKTRSSCNKTGVTTKLCRTILIICNPCRDSRSNIRSKSTIQSSFSKPIA